MHSREAGLECVVDLKTARAAAASEGAESRTGALKLLFDHMATRTSGDERAS